MKKSKTQFHDELLMDGTITFGQHSDGRMFENGKPIEPKADVVVQPPAKANPAPKITDPPKPKVAASSTPKQLYGLERAIAANVSKAGQPVHTTSSNFKPTGLLRAIEANIKAQKSKTNEHSN